MLDRKLVLREEPEIRGFIEGAIRSGEFFALVSNTKNGILAEIDNTYFGFGADGHRKHVSIECRVPCDLYIDTTRGTRRFVPDHIVLVVQKAGCSAETLASFLREWNPVGGATDVRKLVAGANPYASIDGPTLDNSPIVFAYDANEFAREGVMVLVNQFRTWLRTGPSAQFTAFTVDEINRAPVV